MSRGRLTLARSGCSVRFRGSPLLQVPGVMVAWLVPTQLVRVRVLGDLLKGFRAMKILQLSCDGKSIELGDLENIRLDANGLSVMCWLVIGDGGVYEFLRHIKGKVVTGHYDNKEFEIQVDSTNHVLYCGIDFELHGPTKTTFSYSSYVA